MNEPRYFNRMASSLGDKQRLLKHVPPHSTILDVGAGGGELAAYLNTMRHNVVALDSDVTQITTAHPQLRTIELPAENIKELDEKYDVIIMSSVLHEVYSYGNRLESVQKTLEGVHSRLRKGGWLLIRDGVKPSNPTAPAQVEGLLAEFPVAVEEFLTLSPFSLPLEHQHGRTYQGTTHAVMEFAYTYNWGRETFHREALELYGILELEEYTQLLTQLGFQVEEATSYIQDGYLPHLNRKMRIHSEPYGNNWFPTNAIWVARKQ